LHERAANGARAVEAQHQAVLGEAAEELDQRVGVVGRRGPQPQGAAVAEDDVDRPQPRASGHGASRRLWRTGSSSQTSMPANVPGGRSGNYGADRRKSTATRMRPTAAGDAVASSRS